MRSRAQAITPADAPQGPAPAGRVAYPFAFGHWSVREDTLVCRLPRKTLTVTAPGALLGEVLDLCDGRRRWEQVMARLGQHWASHSVRQFLSGLSAQGAIVEAGEALARWSEIGQVPSVYPQAATARELPRLAGRARGRLLPGAGGETATTPAASRLGDLLRARESHRTFADAPLAASALRALAWAAHGVTRPAAEAAVGWHRTVASGGNLHSARWFAYLLRELPGEAGTQATPAGVYEARFHVEGGAALEPVHAAWQDAWRILLDPRVLRFASALLLPVYDIGVPARKYGNRATVFAHVEAGQSLQNAQLMAAALGAAAIVRGDTATGAALASLAGTLRAAPGAGAAPPWLVMPSLVVGARPGEAEVAAQKRDLLFEVSPAPAFPAPAPPGRQAGFAFLATGSVADSPVLGAGRSSDPKLALRKAEAEAWERLGWATPGPCVSGRQADLDGALDPRAFVAYSQRQHARPAFPLAPFSNRRSYLWRAGTEAASGRTVHLPAECLHRLQSLPVAARRHAVTNSSTSGVAAWTDADGALCRATLELVERDAYLRAWLAGTSAPLLAEGSLPSGARLRVASLRAAGYRVALARVGGDWVPVISVFVQRDEPAFTAITAAADFDPKAALHKALDEAEGRVAQACAVPAAPIASAREVQSIDAQCRFWQTPRFFRRADFYAAGPATLSFGAAAKGCCPDWAALQSRLHAEGRSLLAFELTPPGAALDQGRTPLRVVRAFVAGLIPIWFQHGLQPAGLAAFRAAVPRLGRRSDSSFVHPFT
ncbi:hypothetical protein GCM10028796_43550 [Ramlibacter monticola]|uniref:YcaO-like family protein n=1 Tax=Ramlibacter monticola TaxID=1926872 RepID=A0A936Z300_9BURK|nr:YcaO-like family protein [Ramlibacter monticola]MBL0392954.1 YcaO-like family protein [Ramlibacter monticola]